MVRKITALIIAQIVLICCFATSGQCANYDVYENGTISSTYITYYKDILSGQSIMDDYVGFRSGQYTYTLAVGDLEYNGSFTGNGNIKVYTFDTQSSGYNQALKYTVSQDNNFSLNSSDTVLYSNLGDYPQLIERGANFEVFTAILLCICMCSIVINRIFYYRKR